MRIVPQRYPFLMVDKILEQEFEKKAVCQKNVTIGEEVLTGHFENNPIYPGVLLIEMGLQTTQVMMTNIEEVLGPEKKNEKAKQGFILSVEKFKFNRVVHPGDVLKITAVFQEKIMSMIRSSVKIVNQENEAVASGTVVVSSQDGT